MSNYGAESLAYASDKLTGNLADYDPIADVPAYAPATAGLSGAIIDTQPVNEHPVTTTGTAGPSFRNDLYYRVLALPSRLDLGNLMSSEVHEFSLWNTHYVAVTCSAINSAGTGGMTVAPPAPFVIAPLKDVVGELSISTTGPAIIDAEYVFVFGTDGSAAIRITGKRLVIFPYVPEAPLEETLEFLSDIIEAYDGTEQRSAIRSAPRQGFECTVILEPEHRARFAALVAGWQAQVFAWPCWHEQRFLPDAVQTGTEVIVVDTRHADYREGGTALLWASPNRYEAVEIATIDDNTLVLARETLNDYPAGASIAPLRQARLPQSVPIDDIIGAGRAKLTWRVLDNEPLEAYALPVQYRGYDVLEDSRVMAGDAMPREVFRPMETIDFDSGIIAVDSRMDYGRVNSSKLHFDLDDRQAAWEYRRWLHTLAGQVRPFWLPTFTDDLTIAAAFNDTQTSVIVQNVGYARYLLGSPMHRHLCFMLPDGTRLYREIVGAVEGDDGTETLSLDAALGFAGDVEAFQRISYLRLVRLAADRVEISWRKPGRAASTVPTRGVAE